MKDDKQGRLLNIDLNSFAFWFGVACLFHLAC